MRGHKLLGMGIAGQPLNDHAGRDTFDKITDEIDIFLLLQTFVFPLPVVCFQQGSFHHIKQVDLDAVYSQIGDNLSSLQNISSVFKGKP